MDRPNPPNGLTGRPVNAGGMTIRFCELGVETGCGGTVPAAAVAAAGPAAPAAPAACRRGDGSAALMMDRNVLPPVRGDAGDGVAGDPVVGPSTSTRTLPIPHATLRISTEPEKKRPYGPLFSLPPFLSLSLSISHARRRLPRVDWVGRRQHNAQRRRCSRCAILLLLLLLLSRRRRSMVVVVVEVVRNHCRLHGLVNLQASPLEALRGPEGGPGLAPRAALGRIRAFRRNPPAAPLVRCAPTRRSRPHRRPPSTPAPRRN